MRAVKYIAASLSVAVGGYLLLAANGISMNMAAQAQGWHFEVPSHPVARMVAYATVALGLQFITAWLVTPAPITGVAEDAKQGRFWAGYATRVIISLGGAILAALILAFLVMALLDAGLI